MIFNAIHIITIMFNDKGSFRENPVVVDGVVMRPCWRDTFLRIEPGCECTFDRRQGLTTSKARSLVSRLNKDASVDCRYTVRMNGLDDSVTIRRLR